MTMTKNNLSIDFVQIINFFGIGTGLNLLSFLLSLYLNVDSSPWWEIFCGCFSYGEQFSTVNIVQLC